MTGPEKDELIERVLFGKALPEEQRLFDTWLDEDPELKETFEFRKKLAAQLRLNRRNALKTDFKKIREEIEDQKEEEIRIVPIWRKSWFLAAASVLILLGIFQVTRKFTTPGGSEISANIDSLPSKEQKNLDILPEKAAETDSLSASPKKILEIYKLKNLPFYESDEYSLGFAKGAEPSRNVPVLFLTGDTGKYEFEDTLKVYLPRSAWSKDWILIYNRLKDQYVLSDSKDNYGIINGLSGKQKLKKISQD